MDLSPRRKRFDPKVDRWVEVDFLSVEVPDVGVLPVPQLPPIGTWNPHASIDRYDLPRLAKLNRIPLYGLPPAMFLVFMAQRSDTMYRALYLLLALLLVSTVVEMYFSLRHRKKLSANDLSLLEDPENSSFCLVDIGIYDGERSVGNDRGVCWFDSSCLMYSGHRCSFSVGGQDVQTNEFRIGDGVLPYNSERALRLRHPNKFVWITIDSVERNDRVCMESRKRFRISFRDFKKFPKEGTGPRQYPPLMPLKDTKEQAIKDARVARKQKLEARSRELHES